MPLAIFQRSPTAVAISRQLLSLALITALAFLLVIGTCAFLLFPSQHRLAQTTMIYQTTQQIHTQKKASLETQETLDKIWKQMPPRKDFTGLATAISALAKSHQIYIPGMGYDIKDLHHNLANKGTLSFKAAGRYEAIREFIYDLESKWPHLFIEKLTAERAKKPNEVAFSIDISTFLKEGENERSPQQVSSL